MADLLKFGFRVVQHEIPQAGLKYFSPYSGDVVNAVHTILTRAGISVSGETFIAGTLAARMQLGARCIWTAATVIVDARFFTCTHS